MARRRRISCTSARAGVRARDNVPYLPTYLPTLPQYDVSAAEGARARGYGLGLHLRHSPHWGKKKGKTSKKKKMVGMKKKREKKQSLEISWGFRTSAGPWPASGVKEPDVDIGVVS